MILTKKEDLFWRENSNFNYRFEMQSMQNENSTLKFKDHKINAIFRSSRRMKVVHCVHKIISGKRKTWPADAKEKKKGYHTPYTKNSFLSFITNYSNIL